jgi:hypothetical protein
MAKKANPNPNFEEIREDKSNMVQSVIADVTEVLDSAVDYAGDKIGTEKGTKILGGAAVGAIAAVVLPIGLFGGAVLGAGYAFLRNRNK